MDASALIGIAGLVMQAVIIVFLVGVWKGSKEHVDVNLGEKLKEQKEQHARELGDLKALVTKEVARLDNDIGSVRKREHDLADAMQTDRVAIAVLKTKVDQMHAPHTDEDS